jgi:hypothetical protein
MTGTAQVIQIADFRKTSKRARPGRVARPERVTAEPETETCRNFRLRQQRQNNWREADARREYWQIAMKMDGAVSRAQRHGLPEGDQHPEHVPGSCLNAAPASLSFR